MPLYKTPCAAANISPPSLTHRVYERRNLALAHAQGVLTAKLAALPEVPPDAAVSALRGRARTAGMFEGLMLVDHDLTTLRREVWLDNRASWDRTHPCMTKRYWALKLVLEAPNGDTITHSPVWVDEAGKVRNKTEMESL